MARGFSRSPRYRPNGELDDACGAGGLVQTVFEGGEAMAVDVARRPDGRIVAGIVFARTTGCASRSPATHAPRRSRARRRRALSEHGAPSCHHLAPRRRRRPRRAELAWRWRGGTETSLAAFGDPRTRESYALTGRRAASRVRSCFRTAAHAAHVPAGAHPTVRGRHQQGGDHRACARMLVVPPLPLTAPARVQLQASNGACWESLHPIADAFRNDAQRFRGPADRTRPQG